MPCASITSDNVLQLNYIIPSTSVPNTFASALRKSVMSDISRDNVWIRSGTTNTLSSGSQESYKNVRRDFQRRQSQTKIVTRRKNGTALNVVHHVK